ncbi:hypothetical protein SLEP1_g14265 [Rubroshorea leprosula]|uniref:Methylenetetrahydrofolate reductase n=1 Tax=Rubroshorea leprosula TaxID=152421 RepID=A0AAV5IPD7_9ROSI|nr:hypothetical protein SLEP1_g14265 [Rubroshorea leprosula]
MNRMVAHNPAFCDITRGASGSTADLTLDIANKMLNIICVETMMHQSAMFEKNPNLGLREEEEGRRERERIKSKKKKDE